MNADLASHVLEVLRQSGVVEAVVCPGGRNAPFVELLSGPAPQIKPYWHFEERSAAFFALGRIRATGKPVAVITTSGTAAGELLPATMEAYYSGLPLVLVTADRPRRFRGSGAPQSAEQPGIFGIFAPVSLDIEGDDAVEIFGLQTKAPAHINVCFEDPTAGQGIAVPGSQAPAANPTQALTEFLNATRNPLVLVGGLSPHEQEAVRSFLLKMGAPAYLEGLSGLREDTELHEIRIQIGDGLMTRSATSGYQVDGVLRIGGIPTHRMWRDFEDSYGQVPVLSVSGLPFSGLGRQSTMSCGDLGEVLGKAEPRRIPKATGLFENDMELAKDLVNRLTSEPKSEPGMIYALSNQIDPGSNVFLGNSLPVREWDLAATIEDKGFEMFASRGLNGIDGQVSTFFGLCSPKKPNWAILGDLTTLYDLPGAWVTAQLDPMVSATIVVLNNSGGRIFERMFRQKEFLNSHEVGFGNWAKMWGLGYELCSEVVQFGASLPGVRVIEIRPESAATSRFWEEHAKAAK